MVHFHFRKIAKVGPLHVQVIQHALIEDSLCLATTEMYKNVREENDLTSLRWNITICQGTLFDNDTGCMYELIN